MRCPRLAGFILALLAAGGVVACSEDAPVAPGATHTMHMTADTKSPKGYIDGWVNGETVQLHYTKWFFCAEPPESGADSHCEVGAEAEVAPRPGPIPTIYAIAWVGAIQPDTATLACPAGSACLNHPAMMLRTLLSKERPGMTIRPLDAF